MNCLSIMPGSVVYLQDISWYGFASQFLLFLLSNNFGTSLPFLIHLACNLWAMYCRRAGGVWSCLQCFSLAFCLSVSLLLRHRELSLLGEMTWRGVFTCFACVRVSHKPCFLLSSFVPVDDGDISHPCLWLSCWLWNISSEEKEERILFIYLFIAFWHGKWWAGLL